MGLKDIIESDNFNVFFNIEDFAEIHKIDKQDVPVIIDDDRLMYRFNKEFDDIYTGKILYYARVSDFPAQLKQGMLQVFDGKPMYIYDVKVDNGIYEVILHQNRGG